MNRPLLRAFRATVAYDGSGFCGSQLQKVGRTVLGEINSALACVLDHPVRVQVTSRTDSGVHSTGQVIGFRTSAPREPDELYRALNGVLPGDVRVTDVREVDFNFHPRHSSLAKVYLYRILRAKVLPPVSRQYVNFIEEHKPFDIEKLVKASKGLEGKRDFRSFSPRLVPGENPVKLVRKISVDSDETLIEIRVIGSGFLYQMVRRMVGLLIAVASGRVSPGSVAEALEKPVKGSVKYSASAKGLFLEKVLFTEEEIEMEMSKRK